MAGDQEMLLDMGFPLERVEIAVRKGGGSRLILSFYNSELF